MQGQLRFAPARLLCRALGSAPSRQRPGVAQATADAVAPKAEVKEKSRWQLLKEQRRRAPPPKHRIPRGLDEAPAVPKDGQTIGAALDYVRAASWARFDESIDLAVRLAVDPRVSTQVVRTYALLPHGTGVQADVQVLDSDDTEFLSEVRNAKGRNLRNVRVAIASELDIGAVAKAAGRALGPRGLLPNAKDGTVVRGDMKTAAELMATRWVRLRVDRGGNIHTRVGSVKMKKEQVEENILEVMKRLVVARPAGVKKKYVLSASISSTMGKSVPIDLEALAKRTKNYEATTDTVSL